MSRHHFQLTYSITHFRETEKSFAAAKQVRDKLDATLEVWAHCSLMVGDLGDSMEFSF